MINNWQQNRIIHSKEYQVKASLEVNELIFTSKKDKVITLVDGTTLIEFVSCSYLGLDTHPKILNAIKKNIDSYGVTFASARTRIRADSYEILDALLKKIFCDAAPTLFPSVHMVHLGFFPLLGSGEIPSFRAGRNGFNFILDKSSHSSIQINRALLNQFGSVTVLNFNEHEQLKTLAELSYQSKKSPVFIADSIGSMGGITPIHYLLHLADKYNGYVYLDDAHGTSIFGTNGCGCVLDQLQGRFHPRMGIAASLSKAFGTAGGGVLVLPTEDDSNMVKRFSPTYIFGGPIALPIIHASIASAEIHLSEELAQLQDKLQKNIKHFDLLITGNMINKGSKFPIRGLFIGDEIKAIQVAKNLKDRGFAVTTAMYPTVAKKSAILRIALSAMHTTSQIKKLCNEINYLSELETPIDQSLDKEKYPEPISL